MPVLLTNTGYPNWMCAININQHWKPMEFVAVGEGKSLLSCPPRWRDLAPHQCLGALTPVGVAANNRCYKMPRYRKYFNFGCQPLELLAAKIVNGIRSKYWDAIGVDSNRDSPREPHLKSKSNQEDSRSTSSTKFSLAICVSGSKKQTCMQTQLFLSYMAMDKKVRADPKLLTSTPDLLVLATTTYE